MAQSIATANPEKVLDRTVSARQARQKAEPKHQAEIARIETQDRSGAVSRLKSPGNSQALSKIAEYISPARQNRPALPNSDGSIPNRSQTPNLRMQRSQVSATFQE
jgi:hypothetical protein